MLYMCWQEARNRGLVNTSCSRFDQKTHLMGTEGGEANEYHHEQVFAEDYQQLHPRRPS